MRAVRRGILFVSVLLGLLFPLNVFASEKQEIPIIMYHHFDENISSTIVDPVDFAEQMKYLHEAGYQTMTMKELVKYQVEKKPIPENAVVITVDDGYESNYVNMFPVLKQYNQKATVFIITSQVRGGEGLAHPASFNKMTWQQIQEMSATGLIDFQSHTHNSHHKLENKGIQRGALAIYQEGETQEQYRERVKNDLLQSIYWIDHYLGYTPTILSYPFGEFGDELDRYAKELGFLSTVTVIEGHNQVTDNMYRLKRVNICGFDTLEDFVGKVEGTETSKSERCLCLDYKRSLVEISHQGTPSLFEQKFYQPKESNTTLVPVREFMNQLGLQIIWNNQLYQGEVRGKHGILTVASNKEIQANGEVVGNEVLPRYIDGNLYAPLDALVKGLGLHYDQSTGVNKINIIQQ